MDPSPQPWSQPSDIDISQLRVPSRGEITTGLRALANTYESIVWPTGHAPNPLVAQLREFHHWLALKSEPRQEFVLVMSSMRAGSTLLKALLANQPGISHLPETDFQRYAPLPYRWEREMRKLAQESQVILKQPCSFRDSLTYPILPNRADLRQLIIFRDPAQTVLSLQAMNLTKQQYTQLTVADLVTYWCNCYERIVEAAGSNTKALWIGYDSLVGNPKQSTQRILKWIGFDSEGYDSYQKPKHFDWKWNIDDGGPVIWTLQVQRRNENDAIAALKESLLQIPRVQKIYDSLLQLEAEGRAENR